MSKISTQTLIQLKSKLRGINLKRTLRDKNVTKWRIHKDCNIAYRTLNYWQKGTVEPSDELAIKVGVYLGLIKLEEGEKLNLMKQVEELKERIDRLT